jgi:predicted nucleotidyltransferase
MQAGRDARKAAAPEERRQGMDFADLKEPAPSCWQDRPAGIVLEGVVGSRAHGLAGDDSDVDRRGVFLAPSVEFFGLDDVQETADNPYSDEVLHELGRFVRQALKANPAALELLWLDRYEICTEVGQQLIEMRADMLGAARVRSSYLQAAGSLLKVIHRGGERTAKTARHMSRLLITGYGLWYSGVLRVSLPDPDFVHYFEEKVAGGEVVLADQMVAHYERLFAETLTVLPSQPDREKVDAWLKGIRQRALGV